MLEKEQIDSYLDSKEANRANLPGHAGVIPDGNNTWASLHEVPMHEGHSAGANTLIEISRSIKQIDELDAFSIWSMSEKNIDNRTASETEDIMNIISDGLRNQDNIDEFMETGTRFLHLGRKSRLSPDLHDAIRQVEDKTSENKNHILALLIDYGSTFELEHIIQQARELSRDDKRTSRDLSKVLPAYNSLPPLDVLIRSKSRPGKVALSDIGPIVGEAFIYPLEKLWPDVSTYDVLDTFVDFSKTSRNFGGRK